MVENINMKLRSGIPSGYLREATVKGYGGDGNVIVTLSVAKNDQNTSDVSAQLASTWIGPQGQFIGGAPTKGSTVFVTRGASGQWYIVSYTVSDTSFNDSYYSSDSTYMSDLKSGRALFQVQGGTKILMDPIDGIKIGQNKTFLQADPNKNIFSKNYNEELTFTEAHREISGVVKRDLGLSSSTRNSIGYLNSHNYDKSLFAISMDPTSAYAGQTKGNSIKNPKLVERRELIYEFAQSNKVLSDAEEEKQYTKTKSYENKVPGTNRRGLRSDTLSLDIEYPNHLMEKIAGTVVDAFGNILDINRSKLPIGSINELSLKNSDVKAEAYRKIREQLRKSIAYHLEINTREDPATIKPPSDDVEDYDRRRSKLFIDIDKEGQFKINVPASSEIGNIPLPVRYENFSTLYAREDENTSVNTFSKSETGKEIYHKAYSNHQSISLVSGEDVLNGFEAPIDRTTEEQIKYGTVHHDITKVCEFHTKSSPRLAAEISQLQLAPKKDENNKINNEDHFLPYDNIVSDEIIVNGAEANAGGRSGDINLDGFVSVNVGANTIDRQSLWVDYAGGVVANYGSDKQGISYAASLEGDYLMQVGGVSGVGNTNDTRFPDNDTVKDGVVDIRVIVNNGEQMIFRMSNKGIDILSSAGLNIFAQSDIIFKTNSSLKVEAENIIMHAESTKRIIHKKGPKDI
jgi:hypothetical protein